ncbi:MAG: hypothetical protein R3D98_09185 [Candidatus Krumholzibacteriia bacterium]
MRTLSLVATLILALGVRAGGLTLQAAFEAAPALHGYDRYVELAPGVTYDGGLLIGATWDDDRQQFLAEPGADVMIVGHGAILDLQGQEICVSFCSSRLDIEDCIILDGGIRFRGDADPVVDRTPVGSVRYCTFYRPRDYAVRLPGAGAGILLERNLVVDPVDTGLDYVVWVGVAGPNLPTGIAFGLSVQSGTYGLPTVRDNWTWHSDPVRNDNPLYHYVFL